MKHLDREVSQTFKRQLMDITVCYLVCTYILIGFSCHVVSSELR